MNDNLGWMWSYEVGKVVKSKGLGIFGIESRIMYDHVVGFSEVEYETGFETILLVRWQDGTTRPIHPNNVITK
jgi:hypothetical protein